MSLKNLAAAAIDVVLNSTMDEINRQMVATTIQALVNEHAAAIAPRHTRTVRLLIDAPASASVFERELIAAVKPLMDQHNLNFERSPDVRDPLTYFMRERGQPRRAGVVVLLRKPSPHAAACEEATA